MEKVKEQTVKGLDGLKEDLNNQLKQAVMENVKKGIGAGVMAVFKTFYHMFDRANVNEMTFTRSQLEDLEKKLLNSELKVTPVKKPLDN